MTDYPESFLNLCAGKNSTVGAGLDMGNISLDQFTDLQAEKVKRNRERGPLKDAHDFAVLASRYAGRLLGKEVEEDILNAVNVGALLTADHHGALFCSQQIQGDLLFSSLLRKLGYQGRFVPVFSSSQVELGSSTYARGICTYYHKEGKQLFPIFSYEQGKQLASHVKPIDKEKMARFQKTLSVNENNERLRKALSELSKSLFEDEEVLKAASFCDQAALAGAKLSKSLFYSDDGPVFAYLELEEVIKPLLIREVNDKGSLFWRILYDYSLRKQFIDTRMPDGTPFSRLLFRAVDKKGRKIPLDLLEDGDLSGFDYRKNQITYQTEPEVLAELLKEKKLIPGLLIFFLLLCCERGYTCMGGMFQSVYMPQWQQCFIRFFRGAGLEEYAEKISAYDFSGYINGPMFALYGEDDFAAGAGPFEIWLNKPHFSKITDMMRDTRLKDAFLIGLSEMYFDLLAPNQRKEGWYRLIAEGLANRFPDNEVKKDNKRRLIL